MKIPTKIQGEYEEAKYKYLTAKKYIKELGGMDVKEHSMMVFNKCIEVVKQTYPDIIAEIDLRLHLAVYEPSLTIHFKSKDGQNKWVRTVYIVLGTSTPKLIKSVLKAIKRCM